MLLTKPRIKAEETLENAQRTISLAPGRIVKTTSVFDTYWRFAARRQAVFVQRAYGGTPPWTSDPIIRAYRFTNAYRASDRVSQYLIRHVIYDGSQNIEEVFFRTILFKLFNRIDTWKEIVTNLGQPSWKGYDFARYASVLDTMFRRGERIYSAAYIMPSPALGHPRKHRNHLQLLEYMMREKTPRRIAQARSLEAVYDILRAFPSMGPFLAFQFTIDLNYSELIDFSEMDFVVAGPGAKNGIRKCFFDTSGLKEEDIIRAVAERTDFEFSRLGLTFPSLWGRPLQLIDCQNLFCEVDKYARIAHPDIQIGSGRTRIKQKYKPIGLPIPQWYPPKWGISFPPAETIHTQSTHIANRNDFAANEAQ